MGVMDIISYGVDVLQGQRATPWGGAATPGIFDPYGFQPFVGTGGGIGGVPATPTQQATGASPMNGSSLCPPSGSCGGPRYLTYDCRTGEYSVRRRRRRRRIATSQDQADIASLAAIVGKGATLQGIVASRLGR